MKDDMFITYEQYQIAEENGICRNYVQNRVFYLGWSIERAITEPVNKNGNFSKLYTTEQRLVAESNGISQQLLYKRLKSRWDINDAITTPPFNGRRKV